MKKVMKISSVVIVVILIAGLFLTSCGKKSEEKNVIKIGAILPLTGKLSFLGEEYENAMDIINDENSNIEIIYADSKSTAKDGLMAFNKLYNEGVRFFVTLSSSVSLSIISSLGEKRENVLLITHAAHPSIIDSVFTPYIFRHSQVTMQEAEILSSSMDSLMYNKIIFVAPYDDYFFSLGENLKKKKNVNVYFYENMEQIKDIVPKITYSKKDKKTCVFAGGYGSTLGYLIKLIRANGYKNTIYSSISLDLIKGVRKSAGKYFNNIIYPSFYIDSTDILYKRFEKEYENRFGHKPKTFSVMAYNTMLLLERAFDKSDDVSPKSVSEYILSLDKFKGAGEVITINKNGDLLPNIYLKYEK